jgi:hypothetical protein
MKLTRVLLIGSLGLLSSCAPSEAPEVNLPSSAGKFAKYTFPSSITAVRDAMYTAIGQNAGLFALNGKSKDGSVLSTFWVRVAGQSVRVYFQFMTIPDHTVVQVLTEPSPPPTPEALANSLVKLGDQTRAILNLDTYKLEASQ